MCARVYNQILLEAETESLGDITASLTTKVKPASKDTIAWWVKIIWQRKGYI